MIYSMTNKSFILTSSDMFVYLVENSLFCLCLELQNDAFVLWKFISVQSNVIEIWYCFLYEVFFSYRSV